MELNFHKLQIAKLLFLLFSLTLIPFVSSSLRPPYIYFLLNILILSAGAIVPGLPNDINAITNGGKQVNDVSGREETPVTLEATPMGTEKSLKRSPSIQMKKSPSVPCLFFIGGCDGDGTAVEATVAEEEEVYEAMGEISGQELFTRAESFIGNFYRQLKIQREDSFNRIHGLYHKPF
ncbi:unnamed protein product [Spirodela intermedia]|uniref:Uncharacterized protein n=1 Tax=Spirodela intermedia TaxID=51605 RepID=A0A7I8IU85_SPIIN|nr:unnamed protein product [Spirodela intermedia]CAA6661348.1 unnamed protein product [Spirodela intermedia]